MYMYVPHKCMYWCLLEDIFATVPHRFFAPFWSWFRMATVSLQNIMINFPELRHEVLKGMSIFILREIPDSCPLVLENALKTLGQFIPFWRNQLTPPSKDDTVKVADESLLIALSWVESCALVTFCSYRSVARKLSLAIMKEVRLLTSMLHVSRVSCQFLTLFNRRIFLPFIF